MWRKNAAIAGLIVGLLAASDANAAIYSNDFETNTNQFSSSSTVRLPTTGAGFSTIPDSTFLGSFNNNSITLSLTGLTIGQAYSVAFDLFIGKSWDGNSTVLIENNTVNTGPDQWSLVSSSSGTLINTTFINLHPDDGILNNFTQNYSDSNINGSGANPAFTGADVFHDTGPGDYLNRYAIYYFGHGSGNPMISFVANSSTETLTFAGSNLQPVFDEFWAIDNVVVDGVSATALPEPATLTLWSLGALGCAIAGYRRRRAALPPSTISTSPGGACRPFCCASYKSLLRPDSAGW